MKLFSCSFSILVLALLIGCSQASPPPRPSGFLDDYSQLAPSSQVEGALVYVDPDKELRFYTMVIIEPVAVYPFLGANAEHIDKSKLKQLARHFEREVRDAMKDSYPIVKQPGYGVMRVRVAITNVKPSPAGVSVATSFLGLGLGGAAIEAELLDSQSGERLVAFMASAEGKRYKHLLGSTTYGHAEDRLRAWAYLLKDTMDQSRGLHAASEFRSTGGAFQTKTKANWIPRNQ